nr:hypothetical protein Iba_scaffold25959CG0120 [Ipomoea batatas]
MVVAEGVSAANLRIVSNASSLIADYMEVDGGEESLTDWGIGRMLLPNNDPTKDHIVYPATMNPKRPALSSKSAVADLSSSREKCLHNSDWLNSRVFELDSELVTFVVESLVTLRRKVTKNTKITTTATPPATPPTMAPTRTAFLPEICTGGSRLGPTAMLPCVSFNLKISNPFKRAFAHTGPVHAGIVHRKNFRSPNIQPVQSLKSCVVEDKIVIVPRNPFYRAVVNAGGCFSPNVIACGNRNDLDSIDKRKRVRRRSEEERIFRLLSEAGNGVMGFRAKMEADELWARRNRVRASALVYEYMDGAVWDIGDRCVTCCYSLTLNAFRVVGVRCPVAAIGILLRCSSAVMKDVIGGTVSRRSTGTGSCREQVEKEVDHG